MNYRATKIDLILEAFQNGDKLTHLKALAYDTHRLAHFVNVLRNRGWNIISELKVTGTGTRFTEYYLCQLEPRKHFGLSPIPRSKSLVKRDHTNNALSHATAGMA